ncbi:hypothetical protein vseg_005937 [Gypsophila vaccaria]
MPRSSRSSEPLSYDPEPEKTFHRCRAFFREILASAGLQTLESLHEEFAAEQLSFEEDIPIVPIITPPPFSIMPMLQDALRPIQARIPMGSTMPDITAQNYKVDAGLIRCFQESQFGGAHNEDPAEHILNSVDIFNIITHEDTELKQLREIIFPFSLRDKAKKWLNTLNGAARGITD